MATRSEFSFVSDFAAFPLTQKKCIVIAPYSKVNLNAQYLSWILNFMVLLVQPICLLAA